MGGMSTKREMRAICRAPIPGDWADHAACRGMHPGNGHDPHPFFLSKGKPVPRELVALCAGCPVRAHCYAYALKHPVMGMWAGISEKRWREIRKAHRLAQQERRAS